MNIPTTTRLRIEPSASSRRAACASHATFGLRLIPWKRALQTPGATRVSTSLLSRKDTSFGIKRTGADPVLPSERSFIPSGNRQACWKNRGLCNLHVRRAPRLPRRRSAADRGPRRPPSGLHRCVGSSAGGTRLATTGPWMEQRQPYREPAPPMGRCDGCHHWVVATVLSEFDTALLCDRCFRKEVRKRFVAPLLYTTLLVALTFGLFFAFPKLEAVLALLLRMSAVVAALIALLNHTSPSRG